MSPLDRRQFLGRSAALLGAGVVGAAAGVAADDALSNPARMSREEEARRALAGELTTKIPFAGENQAGILTPAQAQGSFVALDVVQPDRGILMAALRDISERARVVTEGDTVGEDEVSAPPPDSGILGPYNDPDQLTVTISFGASLFDHRFGLSHLKPRRLQPMPHFEHDSIDPTRAHGDVLISVCAGQRDTVSHTVRELMRTVAGQLTPRWRIDGFQSAKRGPTQRSKPRNLFAFRDGTANPDVTDARLMNELIWVQKGASEPDWAVGGTYHVVRTIRMHVEFWDRVGMLEQQNMIGRYRVSGAPLGGTREFENPRYDLDPEGKRIPSVAHIRLANPRTPETANQRILRRGYNYDRGIDEEGNLDQGLVFNAFNQDVKRQFATIQRRLEEEEMTDYITPVGGGYFFAPPGAQGSGGWIGAGLFV